jgi:hypothetical protein
MRKGYLGHDVSLHVRNGVEVVGISNSIHLPGHGGISTSVVTPAVRGINEVQARLLRGEASGNIIRITPISDDTTLEESPNSVRRSSLGSYKITTT